MNNYTILNARLVADPKLMTFGTSKLCEVRVADNPVKKTDKKGQAIKARFVTLKFWEFQADLAAKLSKGDVIVPTGELGIETFQGKNGEQDKDVMRVSSFAVSKSESFFAGQPEAREPERTASRDTDDIPF